MGDMTASAKFPDVYPGDLPDDAQFSMVAGDFLEVNIITAAVIAEIQYDIKLNKIKASIYY